MPRAAPAWSPGPRTTARRPRPSPRSASRCSRDVDRMTRPCVPYFPPGRRPGFAVPPGACDSHVHVFGPYSRFPLAEDRSYTPVETPVEAFLAHLDALGFERGVIVTASAQGTDNAAMLDALRRHPARFRGVAVLPPETTDRELDEMTAAG